MPGFQTLIPKNNRSGEIVTWTLKTAIFLIVTIACQQVVAQSRIKGFVLDENRKRISNANVVLINAFDSAEVMRAMTNDSGLYIFTDVTIGDYIIKATAVGFESKSSAMYNVVSSEDDINAGILTLSFNSQQLNEVVVRARKPLFEQRIDRTIINVKGSITSAGTTALDVLERSPGVAVNRQNGMISMAGKEGVVVMINGKMNYMPVNSATLSIPLTIATWWNMQNNLVATWQQVNTHADNTPVRLEQKSIRINSAQIFSLPKDYLIDIWFLSNENVIRCRHIRSDRYVECGCPKENRKRKIEIWCR